MVRTTAAIGHDVIAVELAAISKGQKWPMYAELYSCELVGEEREN